MEYIVITDEINDNTPEADWLDQPHPRGWRYGTIHGNPDHFLRSMRSSTRQNSIGIKPANFSPKAIAFDVDATFIQGETLDEIARAWGCGEKVEALTKLAMNGQCGFSSAISQRVSLLEGMPLQQATEVANRLTPQPYVQNFCLWAASKKIRMFLISGGFTLNVKELAKSNHIDACAANEFEVLDGVLTGKIANKELVDARFKATWLTKMCQKYNIDPRSMVGVGDGANDRFMMDMVGLAVGFKPKEALIPHLQVINRTGSYQFLQDFLELSL